LPHDTRIPDFIRLSSRSAFLCSCRHAKKPATVKQTPKRHHEITECETLTPSSRTPAQLEFPGIVTYEAARSLGTLSPLILPLFFEDTVR